MVVVVVVVVAVLVAFRLMIVVVVVAEVLVVVVMVPIPVPVLVQARVLTINTSRCLLFLVLRLPRQSRLRLLRPLRRLLPVSTFDPQCRHTAKQHLIRHFTHRCIAIYC